MLKLLKTLTLVVVLVWTTPVAADLITFQSSFSILKNAGVVTEGNFQYQTNDFAWETQSTFANPGIALATFFNSNTVDDFPFVGQTLVITRLGGGLFTFNSVDYRTINNSGSDDVTIQGYLGGSLVNALALTANPTVFQTAAGFSGNVDQLRVVVSSHGNNAMILDNFNLSPAQASSVPEPSSMMLAALGLCGAALFRGRLKKRRARQSQAS